MRLTYRPEGQEPRSWDWKPGKMMYPEVAAVEKVTGMTYAEIGQAVIKGSATAAHGLLWCFLKRETPNLKPSQVTFAMDEVAFEYDDDEMLALHDAVVASKDISEEERESVLEMLRDQGIGPVLEARAAEVEADPKGSTSD